MAQINETIVEHWLRRKGYFTVRGLTVETVRWESMGQKELDFLAYHPKTEELLHVEVNSSFRPTGFLGDTSPLEASVRKYIANMFNHDEVQKIREKFFPNPRSLRRMVVYQNLKQKERQLAVLKTGDIDTVNFSEILRDLRENKQERLPFKFNSDADHLATLFLKTSIELGEEKDNSDDQLRRLEVLWEEYKYRHDLCWRVIFRLTSAIVVLAIVPYVYVDVVQRLQYWILLVPSLAIGLVIFGAFLIMNELDALEAVKFEYRNLQKERLFTEEHPEGKIERILKFRRLVYIYFLVLFVLSTINLLVVGQQLAQQ